MRAPGLYDGVDEAVYHSDRESLSQSGAKLILKAPALYRYALDHPTHKDAFDIGHAAHALVLGVGAEVEVIDASDWRTKEAREAKVKAHEAGRTPLLAADYQRVQDMADALSSHTLAMRLLSDGKPEVSAYALHEPTGVLRRCRFDWLGPNVLTDYKSAANVDPHDLAGRYGVVKKWGYDAQAAWYTDVARTLGHPAQAFAFIFQAKEPPHLVTVAYVRDEDLWEARARNAEALERFRDCTDTGIWPGYLSDTAAAALSLTEQTYDTEKIA